MSDGEMLNFDKTQIYGLNESSEMSRDCDVTCQLMSVIATRSDDNATTDTQHENIYANSTAAAQV